jgi:hypothetical protein
MDGPVQSHLNHTRNRLAEILYQKIHFFDWGEERAGNSSYQGLSVKNLYI